MSCFVLTTPAGDVYACSDRCAADVFEVLARSDPGVVAMWWTQDDRDVFCASCGAPLGWRRRSARLLHELMTPAGRRLYAKVHERWWGDVAAR